MIQTKIFAIVCCALVLYSCAEEKASDIFDRSKPVDLSEIIQTYAKYQETDEEDNMVFLYRTLNPELPEDEFYLFEDTSFVLRTPEYAGSSQPFLANAEDFYNSCALAWNVWSNHEVWYRGHTADMLMDDADVRQSICDIDVRIIRDDDIRMAAQQFKDSMLLLMENEPDDWDEDTSPMALLMSYVEAIEGKAYKFYDDEDAFVTALDSVTDIAMEMALPKFEHYLKASEDDQVKVMLGELATCHTFDEQCSLWYNWANCQKSVIDGEWIIAVGCALMKSGNYSPVLNNIWIAWRALCQEIFFGSSRDSSIPNNYYNEYRKMCYTACLKRIESHPDDIYAMNCAAALGGRTNMNRFGQNYFGNEAMIEMATMLPKRFGDDQEDDDEDCEDYEEEEDVEP